MAQIRVLEHEIVIELGLAERIAALRGNVRVPLASVISAEVMPTLAVTGIRAPGIWVPGLSKIGTWRSLHERSLVLARPGAPALQIRLKGETFDNLIVAVSDPYSKREAIRRAIAHPYAHRS
jgi:hypothetical protein